MNPKEWWFWKLAACAQQRLYCSSVFFDMAASAPPVCVLRPNHHSSVAEREEKATADIRHFQGRNRSISCSTAAMLVVCSHRQLSNMPWKSSQIMREIQEHKIKIYEFPETDDEEENKLVKKIKVCHSRAFMVPATLRQRIYSDQYDRFLSCARTSCPWL